jgi:c-di-GMP-binding flagellar brake protein YcgR
MAERRNHPRVESVNHVSYACIDQSDTEFWSGFGRTIDVSENGIMLETEEPVESSCVLLMGVSLQDELIEVKGKIVHTRVDPEGKHRTGIQFVTVRESDRKIIKDFVQASMAHCKPQG